MLSGQLKTSLISAAKNGDALYFEPWEKNQGIIEMRRIHRETKPDTIERMQRAQAAFPPIKALWEKMSGGVVGFALPPQMKNVMNTMFSRVKSDKKYAIRVYNAFPLIADRYGSGTQANGKSRLSFVKMKEDLVCVGLVRK